MNVYDCMSRLLDDQTGMAFTFCEPSGVEMQMGRSRLKRPIETRALLPSNAVANAK